MSSAAKGYEPLEGIFAFLPGLMTNLRKVRLGRWSSEVRLDVRNSYDCKAHAMCRGTYCALRSWVVLILNTTQGGWSCYCEFVDEQMLLREAK